MSPKANVEGPMRFVPHAGGGESSLAGLREGERRSELEGLLTNVAGSKWAWSKANEKEPIRTLVITKRGGST